MAKTRMSFSYDKRADILYLSIGKPKKAVSREVDDGILLRLNPKTKEICGLTIIDFVARFKSPKPRALPIDMEAHLQLV